MLQQELLNFYHVAGTDLGREVSAITAQTGSLFSWHLHSRKKDSKLSNHTINVQNNFIQRSDLQRKQTS